MTSAKRDASQNDLARSFVIMDFLRQTIAIAEVELKKLFRDPVELISRGIQPILWLVIFGQVFSKIKDIPTGNIGYLAYICPGILAQSILFSAIFYGIAVIWERDLGIVHKLLVSPAYRSALVLGKAISAGFRGLIQAFIIFLLAIAMQIEIQWDPLLILGVLFVVVLGSAIFSTFSLVIACIVKTRERFIGVGQLITMPLFFASNAIYPVELMPPWLRILSSANPLTYLVDALRSMMIVGGVSHYGLGIDFLILSLGFVVLIIIASKMYSALAR